MTSAVAPLRLREPFAIMSPQAAETTSTAPPEQRWIDQVRAARDQRLVLRVRGGGSKDRLGDTTRGQVLDTTAWQGVVSYAPDEHLITARAGTPLAEVEAVLARQGQHLAFEPPRWGGTSHASATTVGGMVACGFSGPSRASCGAVRDHVQGLRMVNGRGQLLRFGGPAGQAAADLSRLMTGSMGTLGLLLEVTLRTSPVPQALRTVRLELTQARALALLEHGAGKGWPLDASAWWDGLLVLRLRGLHEVVASAADCFVRDAGAQPVPADMAASFWQGVRDHQDEFFARAHQLVHNGQGRASGVTLWRLSVPAATPPLALPGDSLVEWFGAQRWLCSDAPAATVHEVVARVGGHALAWASGRPQPVVLPPALTRLHRRVQRAFDPDGVFDTGRLWPRVGG